MSDPLKQVTNHLKILRTNLDNLGAESDNQTRFTKRREVAEQYANVDASVRLIPTGITQCTVAFLEAIQGEWFYQPEETETHNRLLYIHGCGGAHGRLSSRLSFAAKIAKITGTAVLAIDYRQLPEYPYPAALADCLAAYSWMLSHGPDDNSSAHHTFVLGEAEGGTFALSTLQNIKHRELKLPDAVIALSPLTDWTGASKSWTTLEAVDPFLSRQFFSEHWRHYIKNSVDLKDPMASPIYGDLKGLPPLLLQVGDREILLDDAKKFARKVLAVGGQVKLEVFPGMPHAFQLFSPFLDEATVALQQIADFIHAQVQQAKAGKVIYMQAKNSGPNNS